MKLFPHKTFLQDFFLLKPIETEMNFCSTMKNLQSETLKK